MPKTTVWLHNNSILCRNKVITNVLVQILVYFSMICSANLKKLVVAGLKITSSQWSVSGSLKAKTAYRSWCIWSFSWSICYWLKPYQKSSQCKVGCQDASLKEGRQVYLKESLLNYPIRRQTSLMSWWPVKWNRDGAVNLGQPLLPRSKR